MRDRGRSAPEREVGAKKSSPGLGVGSESRCVRRQRDAARVVPRVAPVFRAGRRLRYQGLRRRVGL